MLLGDILLGILEGLPTGHRFADDDVGAALADFTTSIAVACAAAGFAVGLLVQRRRIQPAAQARLARA
jgi:hypothetical protein